MSGFTITLKNADGVSADEHLHDLEPATSILAVKELLALRYPGQPPVSAQRMVYAGRCVVPAAVPVGCAADVSVSGAIAHWSEWYA